MARAIQLGDIAIAVTRKDVKHVHLSVHPPDGRVTLVTPRTTRMEVARAYAISKLSWIRAQQDKLRAQARESRRTFVTRESHYVWGKRYLLSVVEREAKPVVTMDHRRRAATIRLNTELVKKPRDLLEYVVVHEMLHLIEPNAQRTIHPSARLPLPGVA